MEHMRILLVSDIHGNMEAFRAVLEGAGAWDELWVLGDLVDYGPEPDRVVDAVRELKPRIVLSGNHDYAVANGVDCGCGEKTHGLSVYTRQHISLKLLSKEQVAWLKGLKPMEEVEAGGVGVIAVHGSPRNPLYDYMLPDLPREVLKKMLAPQSSSYALPGRQRALAQGVIVSGHTHFPADFKIDSSRVLNPGSVGQPRDGDPRASCGLLDTDTLEFRVVRVKYDIGAVLSKLNNLVTDRKVYESLARILLHGRV